MDAVACEAGAALGVPTGTAVAWGVGCEFGFGFGFAFTMIVYRTVPVFAGVALSLTVILKVLVLALVGTPVIVSPTIMSPPGRVPLVMVKV